MTDPNLLFALVSFYFVMYVTPGPNNAMVLTSGLKFGFTNTILILAVIIVLGGFVYLAIIDRQKALRILAGIGIFALLMVIVYASSSSDVPPEMINSEVGLLDEEKIQTPISSCTSTKFQDPISNCSSESAYLQSSVVIP